MPPKTTRIKAPAGFANDAEFHSALSKISVLALEKERLELEREAELQKTREKNSDEIAKRETEIKTLTTQTKSYAVAHRADLLGDKKSAESEQCNWGFALSKPALATLKGWTWERVIEALKGQKLARFIVAKLSPDKEKMKAELNPDTLATVGCTIEQGEVFFITPKRENPDSMRVETGKETV